MALKSQSPRSGLDSGDYDDLETVLDAFADAWDDGRAPAVEDFLARLDPADTRAAVELIFRAFCLTEADDPGVDASQFLERFPQFQAETEPLIRLHGQCPPSLLNRWIDTAPTLDSLPQAGDSIGPYFLRRELGSGGFSRVYLAEQTNLENRLVVLKLSVKITREAWLLARVRHAHIVEIVSHAHVNDEAFHMICMPFWGGATLAAVLAARRESGKSPRSGLDLLADLDSVAAPEFPAVQAARPALEILRGGSYSHAIAWIGARLAEALDHAFRRDVAHGDVKPSNILLAADGNPLLLDFNLARDWSPAGVAWSSMDPGGTIAYMPPERLLALDSYLSARDKPGESILNSKSLADLKAKLDDGECSDTSPIPLSPESHQADLYALGMVLLEALTGQPPVSPNLSTDRAAGEHSGEGCVGPTARAFARARSKDAHSLLREAEKRSGRRISPGLRAILATCLAPEPEHRYRRGLELAEDLDRWRTNRPLVGSPEPFWGQTIPRVLRRQRTVILAAALSLSVIVATANVAIRQSEQTLLSLAMHKLSRLWDDPEAGAYRFQKTSFPRLVQPDNARVETAARAIKEYDVLSSTDWRSRDDVRVLPEDERKDLEVWLMEQAYVYCRALADRPESPKDWLRAVKILDQLGSPNPIPAFTSLRNRIASRPWVAELIQPASARQAEALAKQLPFWGAEYLLGVVAECDFASESAGGVAQLDLSDNADPTSLLGICDEQTRPVAKRALAHYDKFLAVHDRSFWGHYRAAAVLYGLGGRPNFAGAARHLKECVQRRPENPMLHNHLAASLMVLDRHFDAQNEIELAIEEAPDLAEFYRTRARLRITLGQTAGLADDLYHFELLSNTLPRRFWGRSLDGSFGAPDRSDSQNLPFASTFSTADAPGGRTAERYLNDADHEELIDRADLASAIREAGELELATAELGKVLILNPNHIGARISRAAATIESGQVEEALEDVEAVIDDPRLIDYVREEQILKSRVGITARKPVLEVLQVVSRKCCAIGRIKEGQAIARCALNVAIALKQPTGELHYTFARTLVAGRANQIEIDKAAKQLFCAFVANPIAFRKRYARDPAFNAARGPLDKLLKHKPNPHDEYRRRLAVVTGAKGR